METHGSLGFVTTGGITGVGAAAIAVVAVVGGRGSVVLSFDVSPRIDFGGWLERPDRCARLSPSDRRRSTSYKIRDGSLVRLVERRGGGWGMNNLSDESTETCLFISLSCLARHREKMLIFQK